MKRERPLNSHVASWQRGCPVPSLNQGWCPYPLKSCPVCTSCLCGGPEGLQFHVERSRNKRHKKTKEKENTHA